MCIIFAKKINKLSAKRQVDFYKKSLVVTLKSMFSLNCLFFSLYKTQLLSCCAASSRWKQLLYLLSKKTHNWKTSRRLWYYWLNGLTPTEPRHPQLSPSFTAELWLILKDHLGIDKHSWEYEPLLLKARPSVGEPGKSRECWRRCNQQPVRLRVWSRGGQQEPAAHRLHCHIVNLLFIFVLLVAPLQLFNFTDQQSEDNIRIQGCIELICNTRQFCP